MSINVMKLPVMATEGVYVNPKVIQEAMDYLYSLKLDNLLFSTTPGKYVPWQDYISGTRRVVLNRLYGGCRAGSIEIQFIQEFEGGYTGRYYTIVYPSYTGDYMLSGQHGWCENAKTDSAAEVNNSSKLHNIVSAVKNIFHQAKARLART